MLKSIAQPSPDLQAFIQSLNLPLNQAQEQHITQVADALVTIDGRKTLSALYRAITGNPCPKTAADTFRIAPWQADDLRLPLREKPVQDAPVRCEAAHQKPIIFLSLDDSLTDKDQGSKRLQAVDWHFDHVNALPNQPAFAKGFVYVMLRLTVGEVSFTIDMQLYLRASTVWRLNKEREPDKRLTFHSKIDLAQKMLEAVAPFTPTDCRVYVLFDSWYAAASLVKWCRDQELNCYHERWGCEVANWYIAEKLGWADCRLWHVESVDKYLFALWLALAYLEVRKARTYAAHNLADVIRLHRQEHARALLEETCQLVLQVRDLQQVFARYSLAAAWARPANSP